MTPGEFNLMVEAKNEELQRERSFRAAEVLSIIAGFRAKRINAKQIWGTLTGKKVQIDTEGLEDVIAESRERARKAKMKANGNG